MPSEDKIYDFVILGSGLGGLECAYILASEGHSVLVLEKNHQIGGNLQVFSREKSIFDTGVHYIGSLDEGENLNQFFKYFGLLEDLKWHRMDDDCYDLMRFPDGSEYKYAQGYDNFKKTLKEYFPEEAAGIDEYCKKIQEMCTYFPMYNLDPPESNSYTTTTDIVELGAYAYICSITENEKLRNVLAGINPLYAGVKEKTPLFVHALILNSYLTGSYRLKDGGSQIAIHLSRSIRKMGGEILKRKKVVSAKFNDEGLISEVVCENGESYKGKKFISNIHPAQTLDIFGDDRFIKPYRKRIRSLENTKSSFIVHLVLKPETFPYLNYNIYQSFKDDAWEIIESTPEEWPSGYFMCTPATTKSDVYADCMSVMCYMDISEMEEWNQTANTIAAPGQRGESYEAFKKEKAELVIQKLELQFPDIREKIQSIHSTTPLTFRDYIGDETGSMYGILKDRNSPMRSLIDSRTKIKNLFLSGQNNIMHGVLGVTISAFTTCFNFIDKHKLMNKVKAAK